MLDIAFIRENPFLIREAARKKRIEFDVDGFLKLDEEFRGQLTNVEALRAQLNTLSGEISRISEPEKRAQAIEESKKVKEHLEHAETELRGLEERRTLLMYEVPNVPDPSVPEGASDKENQEIRKWGAPPSFSFTPKDHVTLLSELDCADFERGTKVSGFRGYFLKNEAALLSIALWQFVLHTMVKKGFTPLLAPSLLREANFIGTGWLPQGKDEIYQTQDDLFLAGTAEVPVMGMFQGEILNEADLPIKRVAFSPCFRREAGSHGKDTKGVYRVHEFMKVEQVVLARADHTESVKFHEELTENAEEIVQALGLHYRVVVNCGGDLGLGQVKKYDIETWVPSAGVFRETHSSSYFHDFQTRRLNIRYRTSDGTLRFAHSLNNTAIATPRILISLLEHYQREDGSVAIPDVLQSFVGAREIRRG